MNADRHAASRSAIGQARRLVLKVGTNTLIRAENYESISPKIANQNPLDIEFLHSLAHQVATTMRAGKEVLLVTSGAIGMGAKELGLTKRVTEIETRQACAAIGQPILMEEYRRVFAVYGITVAQVLITREAWDNRASYLNLRATIDTLLGMKVLPIFNENDVLSTAEIGNAFGDNDQLSAYIASKADAELLIILTDIDALYTANPRTNPDAQPIAYVERITSDHLAAAEGRGSEFSTGGMATKLKAVDIARDAGCRVVLAHGRTPELLPKLLAGETIGTLFEAEEALKNRTRWIKTASPQGTIFVDAGALQALKDHHSLLPKGIVKIDGAFERGAVVLVNQDLKLVTAYSSNELERIRGKHSSEVAALVPDRADAIVARPEDMAFL